MNEGIPLSNELKWQKKVLISDNPFSGTIVRSVWEDTPDVESINKHLTDKVTSLLKDAMKSHYTRVLLVLGQAGIGKTHFISLMPNANQTDTKKAIDVDIWLLDRVMGRIKVIKRFNYCPECGAENEFARPKSVLNH